MLLSVFGCRCERALRRGRPVAPSTTVVTWRVFATVTTTGALLLAIVWPAHAMSTGNSFPSQSQVISDDSKVIGFKKRVLNRDVEHYLGVPFAQAPVGRLRFKAPRRLGYFGTRTATKLAPACWGWPTLPSAHDRLKKADAIWFNNTEQSEDCLYLNIWTPDVKRAGVRRGGKVVLVWIFGGGFFSGSASLEIYNGGYLAALHDVVVVSMQYRLGPLGFLQLDPDESPGNQGLLDQMMALKWIYENIHYFGGENNMVTLFGESAGSVSVSMHLLSPFTQRYFRRAILQSGSALAWWAVDSASRARVKAYQLAKFAGCYVDR